MPVVWVVALAGGLAALTTGALSRGRRVHVDAVDPLPADHWLIDHLPGSPKLRNHLRHADRHVAGGLGTLLALVVVFLSAAAVGWIFDSIDRGSGFASWDMSVAQWGVDNASEACTDALRTITHAGDTLWLWILLAVASSLDFATRRNPAIFGFATVVGLGIVGLNNGLKWAVDRDRPDVEHLAGSAGSSFPSGHSAASAACWAAAALIAGRHLRHRWRPVLGAVAAFVAIAVAASRALLGVHWLTDVIAGSIIGWGWFFLVALMFGGRLVRLGQPAEAAAVATARARPRSTSGSEVSRR